MAVKKKRRQRLALLDSVRGLTLISMILYHAVWDAVYLLGADWGWYRGEMAFIWQQSICWTFILLSGFCIPLSRKPLSRGLIVFACGALVTLVTCFVVPDQRVIFGVLTLIGSGMILLGILDSLLKQLGGIEIMAVSGLLFIITRCINEGYLGIWRLNLIRLPEKIYANWVTAYLGFPFRGFWSTDYFPLIPWIFLYIFGYGLHQLFRERGLLRGEVWKTRIPVLDTLGRHSLLIYLLHQPLLYMAVLLIQWLT